MDRKNTELTKLYYTIGEVSDMFGVSKSLIRYWESEFTMLKPHKNSKGDRRFTKQNIEQLELIYYLVKEKGFTLDGAKKEIRSEKSILFRRKKILDCLLEIRSGLKQMKEQL
jgi:DNA-binding transcriptional MerR regulator